MVQQEEDDEYAHLDDLQLSDNKQTMEEELPQEAPLATCTGRNVEDMLVTH